MSECARLAWAAPADHARNASAQWLRNGGRAVAEIDVKLKAEKKGPTVGPFILRLIRESPSCFLQTKMIAKCLQYRLALVPRSLFFCSGYWQACHSTYDSSRRCVNPAGARPLPASPGAYLNPAFEHVQYWWREKTRRAERTFVPARAPSTV